MNPSASDDTSLARQISRGRFFYARFRQIIHEGAKFGVVGLIGIGVTYGVFDPLRYSVGLGPLTSLVIATIAATVVTYIGNRYWSFRDRQGMGTQRETVIFFVLNGFGFLIQWAVLGISYHVMGLTSKLQENAAVALGIGLGTLFRFWSYRKWVWIPPEEHARRMRRGRHRVGRPTQPVPNYLSAPQGYPSNDGHATPTARTPADQRVRTH